MSDGEEATQTALVDHEASREDRPAEEAAAVAGDVGPATEVVDPATRRFPAAEGVVEIGVTQVDYTIEGTGSEETPIVHVFGRTEGDAVEHVRVHGFRPYFYVPTDSLSPDSA
jgi:hypothetical protein